MSLLFEYKDYFEGNRSVKSILTIGGGDLGFVPKVSVLMPVYNHPDFFKKSLSSVVNQKGLKDYEIIIVDNNHKDYQHKNQMIVEYFSDKRIKYYVNEKNIGGLGNWNRGIELATAEYVVYCHDDDVLEEDALVSLLECHAQIKNPLAMIIGNKNSIDENDNILTRPSTKSPFLMKRKKFYKMTLNDFFLKNYTNGCGALYNRQCLIETGGFSRNYIPCPDYDLNIRYTYKFGCVMMDKVTFNYRVSSQSDSSNCYSAIQETSKKIWSDLQEALPWPKWLTSFFIERHFEVSNKSTIYHWNKSTEADYKGISVFDRVVVKIVSGLLSFKKYSFI